MSIKHGTTRKPTQWPKSQVTESRTSEASSPLFLTNVLLDRNNLRIPRDKARRIFFLPSIWGTQVSGKTFANLNVFFIPMFNVTSNNSRYSEWLNYHNNHHLIVCFEISRCWWWDNEKKISIVHSLHDHQDIFYRL